MLTARNKGRNGKSSLSGSWVEIVIDILKLKHETQLASFSCFAIGDPIQDYFHGSYS